MSQSQGAQAQLQPTQQTPSAPGTTLNSIPNPLPSAWTSPSGNTTQGAANALQTAQQYAGQPPSSIPTSASGLTWGGQPNWWSNPGVSNVSPGVTMTQGGPVPNMVNPDGSQQGTMTGTQQNAFNQYAAGAGPNAMNGMQWMAAGMPGPTGPAPTPATPSYGPQSLSNPQMQSDMIAAHLPAWANGNPMNRSPYMIGQVPGVQQSVATARNALAANGTPYPSAGIPGQQLGVGDASGMTGQSSMMGGGMGPLASAAMAGLGG